MNPSPSARNSGRPEQKSGEGLSVRHPRWQRRPADAPMIPNRLDVAPATMSRARTDPEHAGRLSPLWAEVARVLTDAGRRAARGRMPENRREHGTQARRDQVAALFDELDVSDGAPVLYKETIERVPAKRDFEFGLEEMQRRRQGGLLACPT